MTNMEGLGHEARSKPSATRRSGGVVPYKPALHELVEGKQTWAEPMSRQAQNLGFIGWHQRGYLPHRDRPGLIQFVTFRLHDGFPTGRRAEWQALLAIEDNRQRRTRLEEYLDRGYGACWLRDSQIAALAEGALRHFNGERYRLLAWAIMPNHVHVLVQVCGTPLASMVQSWKAFTARQANKLLHREGTFWEREYWDTYMRDEKQSIKARRYIEQNPVKARLVVEAKAFQWSSARFRNEDGKLSEVPRA